MSLTLANVEQPAVPSKTSAASEKRNSGRLSLLSLIVFALPTIPTVLLSGPLNGILPTYYSSHTAITVTAMASVLLFARVFDAVTDPLIGYLSDRTRSRLGRRKPWMIGGALIAMACAHNLFVPPASAGTGYFLVWSLIGYLAWSMIFIPYNAWTSELSGAYHERSRIFAIRNLIGGVGAIGFALGPFLLSPLTGTTAINGKTLDLFAWAIVISMPVAMAFAIWMAPAGKPVETQEGSLKGLVHALRTNGPLWNVIVTMTLNGLANGATGALSLMVVDNYLHLGASISIFLAAGVLAQIASVPVWLKLTYRFGKHRPWAVSMAITAVALFLIFAIRPGAAAFVPFMVLTVVNGFMSGSALVVPAAMLSDVIDYDLLKSGVNRAGNYFSFLILLSKIESAIGASLAFFVLGLFHYDPKGANGHWEAMGLMLAFGGVPGVLSAIAAAFAWVYPLDARRQASIRRRIEQRAAREGRAWPAAD
ncbi:MAG: MFS transporter [Rhizomicrobium sp.]